MNTYKGFLVAFAVLFNLISVGQSPGKIVVRDHRQNGGQSMPSGIHPGTIYGSVIVPTTMGRERTLRPKSFSGFYRNVLTYKDVTSLSEFIAKEKSQVVLADVVKLDGVSFTSLQSQDVIELVLIADTLIISGNNKLDFSKNRNGEDGYLAIYCRVLRFINNGQLQVQLTANEQNAYRQFCLFTEELINEDKKVFNDSQLIKERVKRIDIPQPDSSRIDVSKYRAPTAGATKTTNTQKAPVISSPILFVSLGLTKFYANVCKNLNDYAGNVSGLDSFFYEWVISIHQKILNDMQKQDMQLNTVLLVKKYLRAMQLQKYDLPPPFSSRLNAVRSQIFKLRDEKIGLSTAFLRKETTSKSEYSFVSVITANGLESFLPPDISLVKPIGMNKNPLAGYYIYDKNNPVQVTLEFDITLTNNSSKASDLSSYLGKHDEKLSDFSNQLVFDQLYLSGSDIIPQESKVFQICGNQFRIKLAAPTAQSTLFTKLFGIFPSDILLRGKWKVAGNENISGELGIPISLSKMEYKLVSIENGIVKNLTELPIRIDLEEKVKKPEDGKLIVKPNETVKLPPLINNNETTIPYDLVSIMLNPDNSGQYFEQIDEGDRLTQDLIIYNVIPGNPVDSSSGNLLFVDIDVAFERKNANGDSTLLSRRTLKLSPSPAEGSTAKIEIMKSGKEYLPVKISGIAYFENAEYRLKPVRLEEGTLVCHITAELLVK